MRKKLLCGLVMLEFITCAYAQVPQNPIIMDEEDAHDIDSLGTIVDVMNKRGSDKNLEEARKNSWKRKTFFRLSYTISKFEALASDNTNWEEYASKLDGVYDGEDKYHYESDIAASMQWGRNFSLHKKPIAKTVVIALDYTWIDLNWNKYKAFYNEDLPFNSDKRWLEDNDNKSCRFVPWGAEKHEINYGMTLGPSITVAPFGVLDNSARNLHIQGYFHMGYSISAIFMKLDKEFNEGSESFKFFGNWGHGLTRSWGLNLSWKVIGVGFEKRTSSFSYLTFDDDLYGSRKTKFDLYNTRWYLTFNF